jgi:hypothetical protein
MPAHMHRKITREMNVNMAAVAALSQLVNEVERRRLSLLETRIKLEEIEQTAPHLSSLDHGRRARSYRGKSGSIVWCRLARLLDHVAEWFARNVVAAGIWSLWI